MTRRSPTLAAFSLLVGCFVIAVGFFAARSVIASLMLLTLGTQMLVIAALGALPDSSRRARTVLRILVVLLALAVVIFAIEVIVAELR